MGEGSSRFRARLARAFSRAAAAAMTAVLAAGTAATPAANALGERHDDRGSAWAEATAGLDVRYEERGAALMGVSGEDAPENAYRILVGMPSGKKPASGGEVISSFGDAYLVSFDNPGDMSEALTAYGQHALFASADTRFAAAGSLSAPEVNEVTSVHERGMRTGSTPLDELAAKAPGASSGRPLVAIIDTGAREESGAVARMSVLGDDGDDSTGHGSLMVERVLAEAPDAPVLSIKALGDDGRGTVSAVYAAIELARESGAKYINMSFSAKAHMGCAAIDAAIGRAAESGCTVVAAAGNDGDDASKYSPANAPGAYTVGALGAGGRVLPTSNWGPSVDSWVEAETTSLAAARVTGRLSATGADDVGLADAPGADGSGSAPVGAVHERVTEALFTQSAHATLTVATHVHGYNSAPSTTIAGGGGWGSVNSPVSGGGHTLNPFDDFAASVNGNGLSGGLGWQVTSNGAAWSPGNFFTHLRMWLSGQLAAAYRLEYNVHGYHQGPASGRSADGAWASHANDAVDGIGFELVIRPYHHYIQGRYQQADGSWSEYSLHADRYGYGYLQGVPAWSQETNSQYKGASVASYTSSFSDATKYVDFYRQPYTATFDSRGGTPCNSITRLWGAPLGELPVTERYGYRFTGWFTDPDGGTPVTPDTLMPTSDVTYYAHWQQLTVLRYHVDDPTTTWKEVVVDALEEPYAVPEDYTDEARNPRCHHLDGTQGLDAWYTDPSYTHAFEPQTLEAGTFDLYARNWASVRYASGPASEGSVEYTGEDGARGSALVAAGFPSDFERCYRQNVVLSEPASARITYDGGGRFPSTLRQKPGYHFQPDCADPSFASYTCEGDATVYKKWDASITDGVTTIGG